MPGHAGLGGGGMAGGRAYSSVLGVSHDNVGAATLSRAGQSRTISVCTC